MAGLNPSSEGERVVGEKRVRNLREPALGDRNTEKNVYRKRKGRDHTVYHKEPERGL